jgi:translocation and assembly module TamB
MPDEGAMDRGMEPEGVVVVRRRSLAARIAWGVGILLAVIAALLVLLVVIIDTGPGHRLVSDYIRGLNFANGMKIAVGRIEGSIYGTMVLQDVSIKDPKGEFLYSPRIVVDWRPFALIHNHVDIHTATAQRVYLRRAPAFKATPPSNKPLLPNIDIDIDRLQVDDFIAEKPVSGERRVARIAGAAHIASGRAQVRLIARAMSAPGRPGGDRIDLALDAVPQANRLAMNLSLDAPAGGVISSLAGLRQTLNVRAAGRGDWANWNGRLNANLGGAALARLRLTARNSVFAVRGPLQLSGLVSQSYADMFAPVTNLNLAAALHQRRVNLSGSIGSDAFHLDTSGIVDLSANRFQNLKLALALTRPPAVLKNMAASGVNLDLTLNGAFARPQVQYQLSAAHLAASGTGIDGLTASGAASVNPDHILIPVAAHAARITGLDTVAGGTLTNVSLNGDIAIDGTRILSDNLRIRSQRIDARVILVADISKGLYTGAINGRIDDYRIAGVGIFNIDTNAHLTLEKGGFALTGKLRARSTRLENGSVRSFLGGNAVASADVRYGPDGVIHFANLRLEAPAARITGGSGSYAPGGKLTLNATAVTDRYGKIAVNVAGTLANPQASITASNPGLGIGLANLKARITGTKNGYRLAITGDTSYGPLKADVTLGTRGGSSLLINSASLDGVHFAGSLRQTAAGPFAGQLTASGAGFAGVLRLDAQGRYQEVLVNLRANNATFSGPAKLQIGQAIVDARVVLYKQPLVVADVQLANSRINGFDLNAIRLLIDYRNGAGTAQAVLEGTLGAPFRLAANADLQPDLWRIMLNGKTRGVTFATAAPMRIAPHGGTYQILPTTIDFSQGKVRLEGSYGNGLTLKTRLEALDLTVVNAFVPGLGVGGTASGALDFTQASPAAFPRADARLTINGLTHTTAASVSEPVDVDFAGALVPDGGEMSAVFRLRGTVIGRLKASLRPLPPGAGSWTTRLSQAPLSGGIRYNGPADALFSFAGQTNQQLTGPLAVAADFSCRLSKPCINGIIRGQGLSYENSSYGTHLTDMQLTGHFTGDQLQVDQLTAKAGSGTLSAHGQISLAAASGYPMDLVVTLQNARLAHSDAMQARATGDLHLTKTAGQLPVLTGKLTLPETRYKFVREGSTEVPQLTGVRFKPRLREPITGEEQAQSIGSALGKIRLDIKLVAPERLYVSGMGLESEWSADLAVTGTTAQPLLSGEIDLIRGTLSFAGRSFDLSDGRISFTGDPTINPVIRVSGSTDVEDTTITVNVTGRAQNPQIAFTSTPALPQDEIMSRILFGSSLGNLSALQAVQLAASLNSLRGSGGGLDPLGKLRSAAGIDRLRILGPDQTTGRGEAIEAGKYITDKIYVDVITDARGFTATQLEISLTKWLSALAQAGGSNTTNIGVKFKKDY